MIDAGLFGVVTVQLYEFYGIDLQRRESIRPIRRWHRTRSDTRG
jgi:hypothetical protein